METQENGTTAEGLSSESASESEDTSDDNDEDDLRADVDIDNDVESRNSSVYTSSQKTGRTSENRVRYWPSQAITSCTHCTSTHRCSQCVPSRDILHNMTENNNSKLHFRIHLKK